MRSKLIAYLYPTFLVALMLVVFTLLSQSTFFPRQLATLSPDLTSSWFQLAHTGSNAFVSWRFPAGFLSFIELFELELTFAVKLLAFFYLFLLWAGSSLLFFLKGYSKGASCFYALIPALILFLWVELDLTVLAAVSTIPVLISFLLVLPRSPLIGLILAACLGLFVAQIANQLSPFSLLIAFFGALLLKRDLLSAPLFGFFFLFLVLPIIFCLFVAPVPLWPDYPNNSTLVKSQGLPGYIHPSFAPSFSIPIIERTFLKHTLYPSAFLLCALGFLLCIAALFKRAFSVAGIVLFFGMLLVMLATLSNEGLAQISPLLALQRVIPHLFFFPLELLLFACILFLAPLLALTLKKRAEFALIAIGAVLSFIEVNPAYQEARYFPYRAEVVELFYRSSETTRQKIASPSLSLLQKQGSWVVQRAERIQNARFLLARQVEVTPLASHEVYFAPLSNMLKRNPTLRWAVSGGQKGGEWLSLSFPRKKALAGVALQPGAFDTDFPRALDLYSLSNCTAPATDKDSPFLSIRPWMGELAVTNAGFAYHRPNSQVRIIFPEDINTRCLHVVQRGQSRFDWSVARLAFYFAENSTVPHSTEVEHPDSN